MARQGPIYKCGFAVLDRWSHRLFFRPVLYIFGLRVGYKKNASTNFGKIGLFIAHIHKFSENLAPAPEFVSQVCQNLREYMIIYAHLVLFSGWSCFLCLVLTIARVDKAAHKSVYLEKG